ncbi:hypothetical protein BOO69_09690 [Sulfitobacter alexandrii]|uniref:Uncharacterized protein n=1 Tax=Sulfitobacter alexandrii TaxID=1917485 RepID=A0A1J0WHK7_9RHOB|nr:hypothetical protein [Sulfitobacter alexandrii]APE43656.1 hypothetical protein BOO69_09690 [Sulfitobacter alexandrii]
MSFLFVENHPFEWPVKICVPTGGSFKEIVITGIFEAMDDADFYGTGDDLSSRGAMIEFEITRLMQVFKGWKTGDVLDKAQQPIEPTPEAIRRFLGNRPARLAVTDAYTEAMTPSKGYRAKN